MSNFEFPYFHSYPPYYTLQPVKETRERQIALWCDLILQFCRQLKVYKLSTDSGDQSPLFVNSTINRRLDREARKLFLSSLVSQGNALWLDGSQQQCLVLWHTTQQWAAIIAEWARSLAIDVTTVDEISAGEESHGTELAGAPREVIVEALLFMEKKGMVRIFKGNAGDDDGIKFFL